MGDTGQIYSEAPRPGCQLVLRGFHNTCMRWIFFNSIEGLWQEDWLRRRTRRISLVRRQDMANISRISKGQCGHGTVKTNAIRQKSPRLGFRLLPLHLGKSSPVKACRDYGCLEKQGKQWACISGLPAMGAMAI